MPGNLHKVISYAKSDLFYNRNEIIYLKKGGRICKRVAHGMNLCRKPMLVLLGGGPTRIISVYKSYFHAFRLFLEKQLAF